MSLVVLCSATGAPGVTTAGLALMWAWKQAVPGRRALLVDADPAGSSLLPGFLEAGIPAGGGVLGLAAERGLLQDPIVVDRLGEARALCEAARVLVYKVIDLRAKGSPPTAEALLYGIMQLQAKIRRENTIAR